MGLHKNERSTPIIIIWDPCLDFAIAICANSPTTQT